MEEATLEGKTAERVDLGIWFRRLLRSPVGTVGAIMFLSVLIPALLAPTIATHDPMKVTLGERFIPPSFSAGGTSEHLLGTDQLGRDIFSQLVYGARVSLFIGITSVLGSLLIGVLIGMAAGYYGGILDTVLMRLVDMLQSIPSIILLMALVAVLGPSIRTIIIVFTLTWWRTYARLVRGEVLRVKEIDYTSAARAIGAGDVKIMFKHLLPNVIQSSIALATVSVATTIIYESSLSFLGLGPTDMITWGQMIAYGRNYVATSWWMAVIPGLAISYTVLGIVFLGDWLRDVLDPRLRKA